MKVKAALRDAIQRRIAARNGYRFPGLPPTRVLVANHAGPRRLNLVINAIARNSMFGGADTALRLFHALSPRFDQVRVLVVLDEKGTDFSQQDWPGWVRDEPGSTAAKTIGFLAWPGYAPEVHDNDVFMATHWLTCLFVKAARAAQSPARPPRFIYLIQDFEPAFNAWSGRHLLAESTYAVRDEVAAVFNTTLLADYFLKLGYAFNPWFSFEPRLNPALARRLPELAGHQKKRLMLVYGRPSTGRNAFDMVVEALDVWAQRYPDAKRWQLVSLGEQHKPIKLRGGLRLTSLGKVSMEAYAGYLLDAAVGFSLMVSPHPSYPPLEMAEFGARVVTNNYANKDLTGRAANMVSVAEPNPENLGRALIAACEAYSGEPYRTSATTRAFLGTDDEFPFLDDLFKAVLDDREEPATPVIEPNAREVAKAALA